MLLGEGLTPHRVLLVVLLLEGLGVGALVLRHLLLRGDLQETLGNLLGHDAGAGDAHFGEIPTGVDKFRYPQDAALPHAEHQHVRAAVHQHGIAHPVVPVVVVGEAPQRRLHAADGDGNGAVGLANPVGIDRGRPVGAAARAATGGIHVLAAGLLGGGVVVHHGVDHARRDQKAQPGPPEALEILAGVPVGLGQHGHTIARALQHPGDDRQAEGRMIHVGVARHVHKVRLLPAQFAHLRSRHRQKSLCHVSPRSLARPGSPAPRAASRPLRRASAPPPTHLP